MSAKYWARYSRACLVSTGNLLSGCITLHGQNGWDLELRYCGRGRQVCRKIDVRARASHRHQLKDLDEDVIAASAALEAANLRALEVVVDIFLATKDEEEGMLRAPVQ